MGKNFKNTHVKITQGCMDQEMEFTEFSYGRGKTRFVVQRGPWSCWFVYMTIPGQVQHLGKAQEPYNPYWSHWLKDAKIKTLTEFLPHEQEQAERYALNCLMNLVLGWE